MWISGNFHSTFHSLPPVNFDWCQQKGGLIGEEYNIKFIGIRI